MARRSLKPQLNQIRSWVRQGRTDAWIAHQLDVSVKEIDSFKRENDLISGEPAPQAQTGAPTADEELDLRAEDDALVAAELEFNPEVGADEAGESTSEDAATETTAQQRRRRRGRRGGRGRRTGRDQARKLEGTFDHGEEGYGLWLDPAVADDPVYAEHWAGHRPVTVTIEPNRIIIERPQTTDPDDHTQDTTQDPEE